MVQGHKIKQKIEVSQFSEQIQEYKKDDIEATSHTFFRLSEKQRKIYNTSFILKSGFNTPQLAVADFKPQKSLIFDGSQKF